MVSSEWHSLTGQSSNLMFMRRRQAADMILSLTDNCSPSQFARNQLLDALYKLPTDCFIADDWHVILQQVTHRLLHQENRQGARMPTQLTQKLSQLLLRFNTETH